MAGDTSGDGKSVESAETDEPAEDGTELEELRSEIDAVESEFQGKLEDVRERVVQVKREADGKAPADHDHPELRNRIEALESELDALRSDLADARSDIDTGFENFESILENLTDRTDTLTGRTGRLAGAVIDLRRAVEALSEGGGDPVEPIARAANRHGVRRADCEECGEEVDIALLRRPACPHCEASFSDVQPASGWFGSSTLVTGDPPALEPAADDELAAHDIEEIAENEP